MDRETRFIAYHHYDIISDIQIRPIFPSERERWDALIRQHQEADYLFIVKDNQKKLRDDISVLREKDFPPIADKFSKKFPPNIQGRARRRLISIDISKSLNDLKIPLSNHLQANFLLISAVPWLHHLGY